MGCFHKPSPHLSWTKPGVVMKCWTALVAAYVSTFAARPMSVMPARMTGHTQTVVWLGVLRLPRGVTQNVHRTKRAQGHDDVGTTQVSVGQGFPPACYKG